MYVPSLVYSWRGSKEEVVVAGVRWATRHGGAAVLIEAYYRVPLDGFEDVLDLVSMSAGKVFNTARGKYLARFLALEERKPRVGTYLFTKDCPEAFPYN
jgi:hypothetical protein